MATEDEKDEKETTEADASDDASSSASSDESAIEKAEAAEREAEEDAEDDAEPAAAQLGATRYVMAGFFAASIAIAYVLGRTLAAIWARLSEARWFQTNMAALTRVGEEERAEITTVIGAIIAIGGAVYAYRRSDVRQWTDDVASELSKVSWPDKGEVTTSTVIVIVCSAFATVYLALLDRFWGFVTNLVYGS